MNGLKEITREYANQLKKNSIALAQNLGYKQEEIDLLHATDIHIIDENLPDGHWYGRAHYTGEKQGSISLYKRNLLADGKQGLVTSLKQKGMSKIKLEFINLALKFIPEKDLKFLFDQSGMDHELLGHIANYYIDKEHGEEAAVKAQLDAFRLRKGFSKMGIYRAVMKKVGKMILMQHKGEEIRQGL